MKSKPHITKDVSQMAKNYPRTLMGIARRLITLILLLIAVGCAPTIEGYKYAITGKEATPPPRTIEAAKSHFNDSSLIVGQSSVADLQSVLGSPAEISKDQGLKVYVYTVSEHTKGVSRDVGTAYIAKYTFDTNGKLSEKQYLARPMSNPLTN